MALFFNQFDLFTGGGSIGCQTAYHLAKRGLKNVVLLEKDQLTAGTTWHTAGLVWRLRPSDVEIQLLSRMVQLCNSLEEETGVFPGWINNGNTKQQLTKTETKLNKADTELRQ